MPEFAAPIVNVVALGAKLAVSCPVNNVEADNTSVAATLNVLPVAMFQCSLLVQFAFALSQIIVLSVAPLRVIPPPLAVVSVGDATLPISILRSFTLKVVALIVVVVPFTVKLPVTVRLLLTVVVPVLAPRLTVVAAPPTFNVVTVELKTEAVVLVVAIAGEAPFKFNAVALVPVIVGLPIVNVPVAAPMFNAVAAPPTFNVVAVAFTKLKVVCVVVNDAPLTANVELNVAAPVTPNVPPIFVAPTIPTPPATCNAPVVELVLVVDGRILMLLVLAHITCVLVPESPAYTRITSSPAPALASAVIYALASTDLTPPKLDQVLPAP